MDFSKVRATLAASAVDFALNAFWVAAVGVVVTVIAAVWALLGAHPNWLFGFVGALTAFLVVLLATLAMTQLQRRTTQKRALRRRGRKGLLNYLLDRDRAIAAVNASIASIAKETVAIGRLSEKGTAAIDAINRRGGDSVTENAYKRAGQVANAIAKRTEVMAVHANHYAQNSALFMESVTNWLAWMAARNAVVDRHGVATAVAQMGVAIRGAKPNTIGFREAVESNRDLSDQMDVVGERLVGVLDLIIQTMTETEAFCDQITVSAHVSDSEKT